MVASSIYVSIQCWIIECFRVICSVCDSELKPKWPYGIFYIWIGVVSIAMWKILWVSNNVAALDGEIDATDCHARLLSICFSFDYGRFSNRVFGLIIRALEYNLHRSWKSTYLNESLWECHSSRNAQKAHKDSKSVVFPPPNNPFRKLLNNHLSDASAAWACKALSKYGVKLSRHNIRGMCDIAFTKNETLSAFQQSSLLLH